MFENRIEPAFDATNVDEPKASSLRNQLRAWCYHVAAATVKAREVGNRSAALDAFFLEALEALSYSSCADARTLTRLLIRADYMLQLAGFLGVASNPGDQKAFEDQIAERLADEPNDATIDEFVAQGAEYAVEARLQKVGALVFNVQETILAGLCGVAQNTRQAIALAQNARKNREFEAEGVRARIKELRPRDKRDKEVRDQLTAEVEKLESEIQAWRDKERAALDGIVDVLAFLELDSTDQDALAEQARKTGEVAAIAFEIFELGVNFTYGAPQPTSVRVSPAPGKCALFSGDDFETLAAFLERAEFSDLNVWTYGDAIAAHAYPAFKKYRRLAGHYGGARCDQQKDLGAFPGSIVLGAAAAFDEPSDAYSDYVFSMVPTRWANVQTIPRKENGKYDFEAPVRAAFDSCGFGRSKANEKIAVGFGGDGIVGLVDKAARAYRQGSLKRLYAFCGEDAPDASCDYFTRLFDATPSESLTLTCGDVKFRFNRAATAPTSFGAPRLIDLGRERDLNAVVRFVAKFGEELDRTPEKTPVAFFVGLWSELSVAAALAIVALGYRDVFVGPYKPERWDGETVAFLKDKLGVRIVGEPNADLGSLSAI